MKEGESPLVLIKGIAVVLVNLICLKLVALFLLSLIKGIIVIQFVC